MNEYLLMLINQPRDKSITYEKKDKYNPFIEFALYNLTFSLDPKIKDEDKSSIYGKTFYKLEENKKYKLTFEEDGDNSKNASNLLIKYGLSEYPNFSYFRLTNENIKNNSKEQIMSFEPIEDNIKDQFLYENNDIYAIYTIKIYRVSVIDPIIEGNIYENTYNPDYTIKIINNNLRKGEEISYDISFLDYGNYYLSVFAEGRKGNIYEYLAYKPQYYEKIEDLTEKEIDIDYNYKNFTPKYSRSVKYTAKIHTNNDEDYIKLSLKHLNYYDDNYIFVSEDKKLYDTEQFEKLYNNSEYKVINRNTSLIIPVKELKDKTLYIRIPCKELCDYTFYYQIYTKENISINETECFDININEKDVNFKYNIENKEKTSLFTMTSYSINDFMAYNDEDDDNNLLDKTYFNGYSYLYDPKENKKELKFKISGADFRIKVCHRFLNDKANNENNNNNNDYQKIIFDGDIKYSRIQSGKKDCFSIYKNNNNMKDIKHYKMNFITKTKNIKINLYENKNEKKDILSNEESFYYTFESKYDEFCLNSEEDTSVLFQLLSINDNNYINQTLYMPLIRGISTKQHLKKGEILFYRIAENSKNSKLINLDFHTISGKPEVYYTQLNDYPYQSISNSYNLGDEIKGFRNNIKYSINIEKRDIYQKSSIPVIVVKCLNEEKEDDCNYYIEMSNDFETILLNKNRKIYSNIEKDNINNYKIELSLYDIKNKSPKMYIQLYSYTGEPEITISDNTNKNYDYYNYNNNGKLFDLDLNENNLEFKINIQVKNENNSYYSLFYYIIDKDNNEIYLPSGEVHYLIMNKGIMNYYFQDKLKTTNIDYIVSINAINCEIDTSKEGQLSDKFGEERNWNIQKKIKYNEKITISNKLDKKCEYTISAVELTNDNKYKDLIINDRTYQYYKFSKDFNFNSANINYLLSKEDLNKNIFIYVNKKTNNKLKIKYNYENKSSYTLYKNSEMIELTNLTNYSKLDKYSKLYNLSITIEPENQNELENIEFKIKINANKYKYRSYLDPDEIESDIIVKEKEITYYYEYYYDSGANEDHYIEQIYLDCKGIAKLYTNDSKIQENDKDKTYINIPNKRECLNGCVINFSVKLDNEVKNDINIYNIYLVSNYKKLKIFQNANIYGILYNKIQPKFLTDIELGVDKLFFNLNCLKCKAHIQISDQEYTIFKSEIITIPKSHIGKVSYYIENIDDKNKNKNDNFYYYCSILDRKHPKIIYQKESTICQTNCKFILPIYNYFSFTQKNILLYVPETEEVTISEKLYTMENFNYEYLSDFNLENNYDKKSTMLPISNRLIINEEDYIDKNVYILIQVKANLESHFNFTISEFYKLFDEKLILYPTNLFIINDNNEFPVSFDTSYKIKIQLINGSGYFTLDNDNFYLNYESQEIVFIPNNNKKIYFYNSLSNEDFMVYLVMGSGNGNDLTLQKTNYIKSLSSEFRNFEMTFNFETINYTNNDNKDLFINYHFSKLERENNNFELFNISEEKFISEISGCKNNIEKLSVTPNYYNDTRRGYIHIEPSFTQKYNSFKLVIKQYSNKYKYKNVYLEVTPFFIDNKREEPFEFPRNVYLEFNKDKKFSFSKPSNEYDSIKIEYAILNNVSLNKSFNENFGKYNFTIKDDSFKYDMKDYTDKQILLKYTLKKENQSDFYLISNKIQKPEKINNPNKNNTYKISFYNIKNDNITDYKITYLIRLYNYLEFSEDYVINNIFTDTNVEHSLRRELTETEKKEETFSCEIPFGNLDNGDHSISVLGEVYYNDNVEYFSYDFEKFNVSEPKDIAFDVTWIYPLIFVILVFIIIVLVLIKSYINSKNEKKEKDKSSKLLENKINI